MRRIVCIKFGMDIDGSMANRIFKPMLLICCIFFTTDNYAQVLITNPQTPETQLTRNNIRSIFAMRHVQWSDGTPVYVFVLEDNNPSHTTFCKQILGMFPYQLRRIWDRQVFSGTGVAPITVKSEQEMLHKIAQIKGAIGYINSEQVNSTVKIIGDNL